MKTLFRFGILCILLSSCRDEFVFTTPPERAFQYLINSELKPNAIVDLEINESILIGETLENFDRRDAEIVFRGDDVPGGQIEMAFNATSNRYHLVREDFRVHEGMTYEVAILLPGDDVDTILANTRIPKSASFSAEVVSVERIPIDGEFSHHTIEVIVTLGQPLQVPDYYNFIPSRLVSTVKATPGGLIDYTDTPVKELLEVMEVRTNKNAVSYFAPRAGIHIEEARLGSSQLHLLLKTIEPLRDGDDVPMLEGRDALRRIDLELRTMNPELYEYYRYVDELIVNQGANIPSRARSVTNITNASGVFGGMSRTSTNLRIN